MNKYQIPYRILMCLLLAGLGACCSKQSGKDEITGVLQVKELRDIKSLEQDSIALLQLTKKLIRWEEDAQTGRDFEPLLTQQTDRAYAQLNLEKHQQRLIELEQTKLFSKDFIENYDNIASHINKSIKNGMLVWNAGELPPFGTGASPWCNCQDRPDDYLNKIHIGGVKIRDRAATYQWNFGDGEYVSAKAIKENGDWKISWLEGFDYKEMISSFHVTTSFTGT